MIRLVFALAFVIAPIVTGSAAATNALTTASGAGIETQPALEPTVPVAWTDGVDTLHWDGPNDDAIGLTEGGTFWAAVRFTPAEHCRLGNVLWFNHTQPHMAHVVVWGPGTRTSPGEVLAEVNTPTQQESWINAAVPYLDMPAGFDFWVGVKVTHVRTHYPVGVDAGPQVRERGGFIKLDDIWRELFEFELDINWNIRAIVETGVGVKTELLPVDPTYIELVPNPAGGGQVRLTVRGVESPELRVTVFDLSGREVLSRQLQNRMTDIPLDVRHLTSGVYFVQVTADNLVIRDKLVIRN